MASTDTSPNPARALALARCYAILLDAWERMEREARATSGQKDSIAVLSAEDLTEYSGDSQEAGG